MPRSKTPVVSFLLRHIASRTTAFRSATRRRLLLPLPGKLILSVHNYTYFGAQSHGLHPCYTRLRASLTGLTRGFATDLPAKALIRWDLSFLSLTHWVALTYFIDLYLIPRFQIYLGKTSEMLEGHFNYLCFKKKSELVEFSVVYLLRMSERDANPNEAEGSSRMLPYY